ncbi:hypothetical protein BDE36_2140 [Arcticibacter tournemirensis]|nr:hypothetical protein BDE36_2140 [Arcticibacter tournemirensis]
MFNTLTYCYRRMRSNTLDVLSSLIEINTERVLAYERTLIELKKEEERPDIITLFDNLARESNTYKQALNASY